MRKHAKEPVNEELARVAASASLSELARTRARGCLPAARGSRYAMRGVELISGLIRLPGAYERETS